jgi:hypothetical protein
MQTIQQLVTYLFSASGNQPMHNLRMTQMVYLIDWKSCLTNGEQITETKWELNNLGPFSPDILKAIVHNREHFVVDYSVSGELFSINTTIKISDNPIDTHDLDFGTRRIIDFVIGNTLRLDQFEFISFIFSTFPVIKSKKFSLLNLKSLSKEYKHSRFWNNNSSIFDSI